MAKNSLVIFFSASSLSSNLSIKNSVRLSLPVFPVVFFTNSMLVSFLTSATSLLSSILGPMVGSSAALLNSPPNTSTKSLCAAIRFSCPIVVSPINFSVSSFRLTLSLAPTPMMPSRKLPASISSFSGCSNSSFSCDSRYPASRNSSKLLYFDAASSKPFGIFIILLTTSGLILLPVRL